MALDRAIAALEIATPIAEAIPILGTPVKGALEATGKILKYAQEVKSNKEKTKDLAEHAATWFHTLVTTLDDIKQDQKELERLRGQVQGIFRVLGDIQDWLAGQTQQNLLKRTWHKTEDSDTLDKLRRRLHDAFERYMLASQVRIQSNVATSVAVMQAGATAADRDLLNSLGPVSAARFDSLSSPHGCLKDTRTNILTRMGDWCREPNGKLAIYWLAGLAGTGKSTIAKSLCEQLVAEGSAWICTFFASRTSAERRDPLKIIYTFACELAYMDAVIREHVLSAIRSHPDVRQRSMASQVEALLASPLVAARQASTLSTIIFVIDALDECTNIEGIKGGTLLHDLCDALNDLPLKLVVTSRLEDSIKNSFESLSAPVETSLLHDVEPEQVEADVRRVYEVGFSKIAATRHITSHPWPHPDDVATLVKRTGSLFIYAITVLKHIGDRRFSPDARLRQILGKDISKNRKQSPYAEIDSLYSTVLTAAAEDERGQVNEEICERMRSIMGTVIMLQHPHSLDSLALLMGTPQSEIDGDIHALAAVLLVEAEAEDPIIRVFHPSFRDYLSERCDDPRFAIDPTQQHHELGLSCMRLLNEHLQQDICEIKDPTLSNADIINPSLKSRLDSNVPAAVRYACSFWAVHISMVGRPSPDLLDTFNTFTQQHSLHWIELLSLLGNLSAACAAIPNIIMWCQKHTESVLHSIEIMLTDVYKTVLAYEPILHTRPLHIYYSALVTIPSCTLFLSVQTQLPKDLPLLVSPRAPEWHGTDHEVLEGHGGSVTSIAMAWDGSRYVSGSLDNTVRVWNTSDKTVSRVFMGHTGPVLSVACPSPSSVGSDYPDSLPFCVSGSEDMTIRIWDTSGQKETVLFQGHTDSVLSVAILDASIVASGSADHTIRLWTIASAEQLAVLTGHTDRVTSVAFTMDELLASGSFDKTIRLWDSVSLQQLHVFEGHSGRVRCLAVTSGVPQTVVSGSDDWTVRSWSIDPPEASSVMHGHAGPVLSVASSLLGDYVVSSSEDMTIRVWNVASGEQRAVLQEWGIERRMKGSAVFESDEVIMAASGDKMMRLWTTNGICLPGPREITGKPLERHAGAVLCAVFSSHGLWIATGSEDQTGRIWDARSGRLLSVLEGHRGWVYSVDFSPDDKRLLTASVDKTVRIWATGSWEQELVLDNNPNLMSHVKFAPDGIHIMVGFEDDIIAWNTNERETHTGPTIRMAPDTIIAPKEVGSMEWATADNAWITWPLTDKSTIQICWLPAELRGVSEAYTISVNTGWAAIGSLTGIVTIINLSQTLSMLECLGIKIKYA